MSPFKNIFSWTATLEERQRKQLHIINELQRARLFLCCLFCSTGVSIVYIFELFSAEFSSRYGFSAGDLSTISTVGAAFCYFLLQYAVVYEYMGPTPLLLFAAVTGFVGMLGLGLIFQGTIPGSLLTICVFYAIMNTCAGLFDAASIVTLQQTFPRNRGPVLGLAKVMTGLGSSVFASISSNLFGANVSSFLYFMMVYAIVVSIVSSFVLSLPPYVVNWWRGRHMTEEEKDAARSLSVVYDSKNMPIRRLIIGYTVGISLILLFTISSPIIAYKGVSQQARYVIGAITCALMCSYGFIALPVRCLGGVDEPTPELALRKGTEGGIELGEEETPVAEAELSAFPREAPQPLRQTHQPQRSPRKAETVDSDQAEEVRKPPAQPIVGDVEIGSGSGSVESEAENERALGLYAAYMDPDVVKYTDPKYPGTIWDALCLPDMYLIYLGFILQGAIGTIVLYNSSTIYVARTGKSRSRQLSALYTAFLGIGSALGRIAVGLFEAFVQRQPEGKRRLLITLVLPFPAIIGTIGGLLILVLPGNALLLPYILIYFKQGAFYSTCAVAFPSLYRSHLSFYYNLSSATTVVCVICFNRFLFGYMVDKKRNELNLTGDCTSRDCILVPIVVSTCLSAVASVLLLIVHIRYTRFVRRYEKKMRSQMMDEAGCAPVNVDAIDAMPSEGEEATGAADVGEVRVGTHNHVSSQK